MQFKAVIFDMDGTLVDSLKAYQVAFNNGVAKFGLPPVALREIADRLNDGMLLEQIIVDLFPDHDDPAFLKACREEIFSAFRDVTEDKTPLLPGTKEVLRTLRAKGMKIGLATGRTTPSERVKNWLENIGIGEFFDVIVTSDDVAERKPAPDCVVECARLLGVPTAECLMVGDSLADISAAKAAGASVVAVLTGVAGQERLSAAEPMAVLKDLYELIPLLVPSPGIDRGDEGKQTR
ncbi:MAG: HAD family hydrolase [Chloroflexi bacterium]|nr:HAD family hydrolase [Chloroflexota bacterium]